MQEFIINIMNEFGYLGVLFLITIENIFPPIPSEIILPFSGFMTIITDMTIFGVVLMATIGSVIGAIILYLVGSLLKKDRLRLIIDGKIGKTLHFKFEDIEKDYLWFERKGGPAVFLCRCVPIVRSLISIPAGMSQMNFVLFLILTIIGTLVWNIVLVYLGAQAGASWENISSLISEYSHVIKFVLLAVGALMIAIYFCRKIIKINKFEKIDSKE